MNTNDMALLRLQQWVRATVKLNDHGRMYNANAAQTRNVRRVSVSDHVTTDGKQIVRVRDGKRRYEIEVSAFGPMPWAHVVDRLRELGVDL